jgi:hypothetical protein
MKQLLSVTAISLLAVASLTACSSEEGFSQQPTIELGEDTTSDPLVVPLDPEAPENEGLRLPSEEETIAGAIREASDLGLTITSVMLSYGPNDSARSKISDLRPLTSGDLLNKLAAEIQERDWGSIRSGTTAYIADVTDLEVIEYRGEIPEVVEAKANVFVVEDGEYSESPLFSETWHITVAPAGFSNSLIATEAVRVG